MKLKNAVAVAAVAVAAAGVWLWQRPAAEADAAGEGADGVRRAEVRKIREAKLRERQARRDKRRKERLAGGAVETRIEREKPEIAIDAGDDETLTAEMKSVLREIRNALDFADLQALMKAVERLKAQGRALAAANGGGHWTAHVPQRVQEAAVESLGWFAGGALPELMEFLASENPDVVQMATDQFELAMQDFSLGDRGRADVIKMVSQVISDRDTLDWVLSSAIDARHSVGIDTLVFVSQNGTEAAKEMVPEYLELFTGGEEIATAGDAAKWLAENPDDPDDEQFFGPMAD